MEYRLVFALLSWTILMGGLAAWPALAQSDDPPPEPDEEPAYTIVVKENPKRGSGGGSGCGACGPMTITIYSDAQIRAKVDVPRVGKMTPDEKAQLALCMDLVHEMHVDYYVTGIAAAENRRLRTNPVARDTLAKSVASNRALERRWQEAGCDEFLSPDLPKAIEDVAFPAGQNANDG